MMTSSLRTLSALAVGALLFAASSRALGQEGPESGVEIHGFVSQGFIKSTENNYLGPSERGSFEFTEAAINFTHSPLDDLRIGAQLFVHDIGPLGNYRTLFDWYYLDYRIFDWLGIRAGRTKIPFGLYNELNDVDAARVPILLPQAVYPVSSREFLLAQTGVELYGDLLLGAGGGTLSYRAYGGTIYLDPTNVSAAVQGFTVPYVIGGRLMYSPPIDGLSFGGSVQALRLDFDFEPTAEQLADYTAQGVLPGDFDGRVLARIPVLLAVASLEYERDELLLAAEYLRQYLDIESSLLMPITHTLSHGVYALASYRVAPWLTPGVYYSAMLPDTTGRAGPSKYQHDVALTLRFDINAHWLLKLEGHYMHGTAGLTPDLNADTPIDALEPNWGVLLIKTTAYF